MLTEMGSWNTPSAGGAIVHDLGKIHTEDGQEKFQVYAADVKAFHRATNESFAATTCRTSSGLSVHFVYLIHLRKCGLW